VPYKRLPVLPSTISPTKHLAIHNLWLTKCQQINLYTNKPKSFLLLHLLSLHMANTHLTSPALLIVNISQFRNTCKRIQVNVSYTWWWLSESKHVLRNDECVVCPYYLLWWGNKINKFHTHNMTLRYNITPLCMESQPPSGDKHSLFHRIFIICWFFNNFVPYNFSHPHWI
jgi:hypothetical protein